MDALVEDEIVVAGQDVPHLEVGAAGGVMTHISYGFATPQMTFRLPPAPPVPDVIAIAPFPSPAFHMQAPSWRAMLRALAHMADTKIEATPRALAKLGGEPARLRAVVQFVKVPLAESQWRTVLYLSLDNRVPPNTHQAWRFTNNDTTRLPYSFPVPQQGASAPSLVNTPEAPLYVFPAPHAELPLSMPGVARFLTEKMAEARAETSNKSSTRRLAKIVDACYPEPREKREPGDRRAALLGRLFGRGGARKSGPENDQTYDLVTPFRMDDWG
ncbi:hypothetical protein AURDEDRAFT_117180 [Auricularia subglabra TFB-10046 SS5]|nr:hypothetical protein AURDEDRAFT_117180 [Auricularia subglabra TFB-10046 SS5]